MGVTSQSITKYKDGVPCFTVAIWTSSVTALQTKIATENVVKI